MKEFVNGYPAFAFLPGLILGAVYFGGLWLTVRRALTSRSPGLYFLGSYVLRVVICLAGFYYVGMGSWQITLICLAGFIMARYLVLFATKRIEKQEKSSTKFKSHEA
ncbi:ATP synthase subunit I [Arundinibacter roseus]|uniref:ATP synthase subunit I n=1 Tax=Arundinibacter roseus TaxID=2070510 RepID=A0A4R4KIK6_9BACT|nr:ATP synthase subunit I [Arundinibacter roseus]TDB68040.1 ATP synthase subunit I [Arundinibacter roseus]